MFEPITFPTASPPDPLKAASSEMTSSGADVPKATMVNPMMSGEMPMRRASPTAPFTRKSPPTTRPTSPSRNRNATRIMREELRRGSVRRIWCAGRRDQTASQKARPGQADGFSAASSG